MLVSLAVKLGYIQSQAVNEWGTKLITLSCF